MPNTVHMIHFLFFFFNDTATTEIYTLSLHDALPISDGEGTGSGRKPAGGGALLPHQRSEEHTSELQSRENLVCRLLLEQKKKKARISTPPHYIRYTLVHRSDGSTS